VTAAGEEAGSGWSWFLLDEGTSENAQATEAFSSATPQQHGVDDLLFPGYLKDASSNPFIDHQGDAMH
jgi:hypothetical protein